MMTSTKSDEGEYLSNVVDGSFVYSADMKLWLRGRCISAGKDLNFPVCRVYLSLRMEISIILFSRSTSSNTSLIDCKRCIRSD
jgi:hypothetical protein